MTDIEQYAQRYAERIEAALIGACPRAVIRAEALATARYATRLATRVVEMAGGTPVQPDNPIDRGDWFGMDAIIEWATWAAHTEGTEASDCEKAICIAHAITEAVQEYDAAKDRERALTPVSDAPAPDDRCPECIRRDSRVRWHDDGSVWYCPIEGCANHADAERDANGKDGAR